MIIEEIKKYIVIIQEMYDDPLFVTVDGHISNPLSIKIRKFYRSHERETDYYKTEPRFVYNHEIIQDLLLIVMKLQEEAEKQFNPNSHTSAMINFLVNYYSESELNDPVYYKDEDMNTDAFWKPLRKP